MRGDLPSGLSCAERGRILEKLLLENDRLFEAIEASAAKRDREIARARQDAVERRGAPPQQNVTLAATHEAGHAVVSAICGVKVVGCLIRANGTGTCWVEPSDDNDVGHLAGAVAERLAGNVTAEPSATDRALIRGDRWSVARSGFDAEDLLAENWKKVERVAHMLVTHGYVSGQLVHEAAGSGYV